MVYIHMEIHISLCLFKMYPLFMSTVFLPAIFEQPFHKGSAFDFLNMIRVNRALDRAYFFPILVFRDAFVPLAVFHPHFSNDFVAIHYFHFDILVTKIHLYYLSIFFIHNSI